MVVLFTMALRPPNEPESRPLSSHDEVAVGALYREHASFVWRNARRLGADDAWVDDVVHEVFLVVARRLNEWRAGASIRTWLFAMTFRIVKNMRRNRFRDQEKVARHSLELPPPFHPESQAAASRTLRDMLAQLDDAKRVVYILAELEGMTSIEIAGMLGVPVGTVDTRLRAARLALTRIAERIVAIERRAL